MSRLDLPKKNRVTSEKRVLRYIEAKWERHMEEYKTLKRLNQIGEMPERRLWYYAGYLDGLSNLREDIMEGLIWKGGDKK